MIHINSHSIPMVWKLWITGKLFTTNSWTTWEKKVRRPMSLVNVLVEKYSKFFFGVGREGMQRDFSLYIHRINIHNIRMCQYLHKYFWYTLWREFWCNWCFSPMQFSKRINIFTVCMKGRGAHVFIYIWEKKQQHIFVGY